MKSDLALLRVVLLIIPLFSVSCSGTNSTDAIPSPSSSPSPSSQSEEDKGYLSFVFNMDNTLKTYVTCSIGENGIVCDSPSQPIPTFHSYRVYNNFEKSQIMRISRLDNGCFTSLPTSEEGVVDWLTPFNTDNCRYSLRFFAGTSTSGQPAFDLGEAGSSKDSVLSGLFPFLSTYSMTFTNTKLTGPCDQTAILEVPAGGKRTDTIPEGSMAFSTLFSLEADQSMLSQATASRSSDFTFKFHPAMDTSAVPAGSEDALVQKLSQNLGDFVLLKVSSQNQNTVYCKAPDAVTGSVTIPQSFMAKLDGSTGFNITRYKINKLILSPKVEFLIITKVGMYTTSTDAWGQDGGSVNIWVGN